MAGAIATGLGCAHNEVPLQTEFKAPLALRWIRRNFLFKYLPADSGLAKTRRNFPAGHIGSWEIKSGQFEEGQGSKGLHANRK